MPAVTTLAGVSAGTRVATKQKMRYGDRYLEQGEVFELEGAMNDARLVHYGYVQVLDKGAKTWPCSGCNVRVFSSEGALRAHQRREHG